MEPTPPPHTPRPPEHAHLSLLISRIRGQQVIGFQVIAKHTRMVMTAKWGMGVLALGLAALLIILPMSVPKEATMRLAFSNITVADGQKPAMINPRFEGLDEENQPYTVSAKQAVQRNETLIDLDALQADLGLSGGNNWLNITAQTGVYERDKKFLWLRGNVSLFFDNGYEAHTEQADIDLTHSIAQGMTEVNMQGPLGTLRADQYRIEQTAKRAFFTGNVRMVLYLEGKQ